MTAPAVVYREPARGYITSWVLLAALGGGFALDATIGGAATHAVAWIVAAVLVVGIDALGVHASRTLRSITVTDDELRVGNDERIPRADWSVPRSRSTRWHRCSAARRAPGCRASCRACSCTATTTATSSSPPSSRNALAAALGLPLSHDIGVRPARPAELAALPDVEDRSGSLFTVAGIDLPPDVLTVEELRAAAVVFVAGDPPVGFAMVDVLDGQAYLHQLSVLPSHMRRGLGGALIEATCDWAREHGYRAVTLTTFTDVPWNGAVLPSRGFVELPDPPPELAAVRAAEVAAGLDDVQPRCTMIRVL